jgi:hypothetical protein
MPRVRHDPHRTASLAGETIMIGRLRFARSFLTAEREYALRRAVNMVMPVAHRSRHDYVIHACVWKSASQWVRMVLSDPRVYRHSGLQPMPCDAETWKTLVEQDWSVPRRRIVTPVYATYASVKTALAAHGGVSFFVKRDPRDLLVSRYFSRLSAHPLSPKIAQLRKELEGMSERDGLIHVLGDFQPIASILDSWSRIDGTPDPRVVVTSYEALTGVDGAPAWRAVLDHCDIRLTDAEIEALLERYSFKNLSGGREAGEEVKSHKYRKGQAGDWLNYFDDDLKTAFVAATGDLTERLGYRW